MCIRLCKVHRILMKKLKQLKIKKQTIFPCVFLLLYFKRFIHVLYKKEIYNIET